MPILKHTSRIYILRMISLCASILAHLVATGGPGAPNDWKNVGSNLSFGERNSATPIQGYKATAEQLTSQQWTMYLPGLLSVLRSLTYDSVCDSFNDHVTKVDVLDCIGAVLTSAPRSACEWFLSCNGPALLCQLGWPIGCENLQAKIVHQLEIVVGLHAFRTGLNHVSTSKHPIETWLRNFALKDDTATEDDEGLPSRMLMAGLAPSLLWMSSVSEETSEAIERLSSQFPFSLQWIAPQQHPFSAPTSSNKVNNSSQSDPAATSRGMQRSWTPYCGVIAALLINQIAIYTVLKNALVNMTTVYAIFFLMLHAMRC